MRLIPRWMVSAAVLLSALLGWTAPASAKRRPLLPGPSEVLRRVATWMEAPHAAPITYRITFPLSAAQPADRTAKARSAAAALWTTESHETMASASQGTGPVIRYEF